MSNEENKKPKQEDERVHLDMSFEDAMRLAMKTPAPITVELTSYKEVEIKNASGMIVLFDIIETPPHEITKFALKVKIVSLSGSIRIYYIAFTYGHELFDLSTLKIKDIKDENPISIELGEILFVTLENGAKDNTWVGKLTYWVKKP